MSTPPSPRSTSTRGARYDYGYDGRFSLLDGAVVTYDDRGNRSNCLTDAADRARNCNGASYKYDANDRLATRGTTETFTYDDFGALQSYSGNIVCKPMGSFCQWQPGTVTYQNDVRGRRIVRTGQSGTGKFSRTTSYIYGDALLPLAQIDNWPGHLESISYYLYASHSHVPDAMIRDGVLYRIITDHLGSVRVVVNASTGAVMESRRYDTFGKIELWDIDEQSWAPVVFGFAGGLHDKSSGLVRFGARDLDTVSGKWTAPDPLKFGGGSWNLFEYAGGGSGESD